MPLSDHAGDVLTALSMPLDMQMVTVSAVLSHCQTSAMSPSQMLSLKVINARGFARCKTRCVFGSTRHANGAIRHYAIDTAT